jgi:mRNA interferase MazF
MTKGDIILIPFPFTDLKGNKLRPAVVLISASKDITVCFITSQLKWKEPGDISIFPSSENGLKKTSLIRTGKIATLDQRLAVGRLGSLEQEDISALNRQLRQIFRL